MEWIEDVLAWLCKYGCVSAPRDELRKMVSFQDYEEPGCLY